MEGGGATKYLMWGEVLERDTHKTCCFIRISHQKLQQASNSLSSLIISNSAIHTCTSIILSSDTLRKLNMSKLPLSISNKNRKSLKVMKVLTV